MARWVIAWLGGWVVFFQELFPLRGSILPAVTCHILSLAENPRWSRVWQQLNTQTLKRRFNQSHMIAKVRLLLGRIFCEATMQHLGLGLLFLCFLTAWFHKALPLPIHIPVFRFVFHPRGCPLQTSHNEVTRPSTQPPLFIIMLPCRAVINNHSNTCHF